VTVVTFYDFPSSEFLKYQDTFVSDGNELLFQLCITVITIIVFDLLEMPSDQFPPLPTTLINRPTPTILEHHPFEGEKRFMEAQ
jgi:hypothetical protein